MLTMDEIVEAELQRRGAPTDEENKRIVVIHWMMLLAESPSGWPSALAGREHEFITWATKYRRKK
jgi:hypothetical protein